jgi:hypothetical protein
MLETLFPKEANNHYKGHKLAKWLLYLYVFKSFFAGCIHMFASDGGAMSIGSVALDQFTQGGADSVITMFGLWGAEQFVIGIIAVIVLWRYKSLVPMMLGIYAIEYSFRGLAHLFTPGLVTANTPPGAAADTILVPLAIVMFIIALYTSKKTINEKL